MLIRSFIAVPVPREMANTLGDVAAQMAYQDKSNAVRWVDQANYHITLAFLDQQNERDLESLAEQLDHYLPQTSFDISISHLSPFPESKPKLIAAMVNKSEPLIDLHKQVMSALLASPIIPDKRRFMPHITLGRYRHTKKPFMGAMPTVVEASGELSEVALYESTLTANGAEYEAMFRFPLDPFEFAPDLDWEDKL
ncbi:MAG: 2'-5' RNA ligase [Arenicella sp.]|jgi:2'-5' RNA ligase